MIKIVSVSVETESSQLVHREPIVAGIPVPMGLVFAVEKLQLFTADGVSIPAYFSALSTWPDGSFKWLNLYFQADSKCGAFEVLYDQGGTLQVNTGQVKNYHEIAIQEHNSVVTVDTGVATFLVDLEHSLPFKQVIVNGIEQLSSRGSRLIMEDQNGDLLEFKISSYELGDDLNPLQRTLTFKGYFFSSYRNPFVKFTMEVTFYSGHSVAKISISVLNSSAAIHSKGVWDLGDAGSVLFSSLLLEVHISNKSKEGFSLSTKLGSNTEWDDIGNAHYSLYQGSSGGVNWKSRNHVNAKNRVPIKIQGYRGYRNGEEVHRGLRANPLFKYESTSVNFCAYLDHFWQNFPKEIEVSHNFIRLKLFPNQFSDVFELQGGEQKTHTCFLDFSGDCLASNWFTSPRIAQISAKYYSGSRLIPFLSSVIYQDDLQKIINLGVFGKNNFFVKREIIDEFGWRNFGDIFADHEQLEYKGSLPLISHYNNQYDALDGFLRQYILSGDRRWFELANDLARHVVDIDIYHTSEDREHYNGGLFWHTDHYSNAFTCTHRTFSARNLTSYDGEVGGGPGPEHCYTTGLMHFYFFTGDITYKNAALGLVIWIKNSFEGSGAILDRLHQFLRKDISTIRKLLSGQRLQDYRYPFTRASGNYINALLDAYQLTDEPRYISEAESVIQCTVHPQDDISLRNLEDIESSWSYLIFLQALCKYLCMKSALRQIDSAFCYARDCLLHYANWVLENERPFLESSSYLDFANSTWTAQDLRKAYVLRIAACFETKNKKKYFSESRYYREYVSKQLKDDEHNYYARIIVILMQNYFPDNGEVESWLVGEIDSPCNIDFGSAPMHSFGSVLTGFVVDLFKRLCHLSLSQEIQWLKFRMRSRY